MFVYNVRRARAQFGVCCVRKSYPHSLRIGSSHTRARTHAQQRRQIKRDFRFRDSRHVCRSRLCKSRSQTRCVAAAARRVPVWVRRVVEFPTIRNVRAVNLATRHATPDQEAVYSRVVRSHIQSHNSARNTLTAHSIIETCALNKLVCRTHGAHTLCGALQVAHALRSSKLRPFRDAFTIAHWGGCLGGWPSSCYCRNKHAHATRTSRQMLTGRVLVRGGTLQNLAQRQGERVRCAVHT